MKVSFRFVAFVVAVLAVTLSVFAQQASKPSSQEGKKPGIVEASELKQVVPTNFFFDDQVAPVQMRNAVAIRTQDGKVVSAGLVDNSGYSSDVAQKYQGFLITSKKITIEGQPLNPGQYGFGFSKDGKFLVMDVSTADVFSVDCHTDEALKRPSPLKAVASGNDYRLYAGKKYVTISM